MAEISQEPGKLDITYMTKGYAYTFQSRHEGDITTDTFESFIIDSNGTTIPLTVTKSYDSGLSKTVLTHYLSVSNSLLLTIGHAARWACVQTSNSIPRPILAGNWMAYSI